MRIVLAALAGGLAGALATFLWMLLGKQAPPTVVPAATAVGSALLVSNLLKKKNAPST
jgi:hypothetical protein